MKIIRLLTVELFRDIQPLDEDVDAIKLKKIIYAAQETKIQQFLGTVFYNKILTIVDNDSITDPVNEHYKYLLDNYILKVLSYWAYVDAIPHMSFPFTDKGLQQRDGNHSKGVDPATVRSRQQAATNQAEFHSNLMVTYICNHSAKYPEYNRITDGIGANKKPFFPGMELDYFDSERNPLEQP